MAQPGYSVMRDAITAANVNNDAEFSFDESSHVVGTLTLHQLSVTYQSGNEYLSIDRLINELKSKMDFKLFELRGRGGDDGSVRLVCDCDLDGTHYQLVYHLPS